MRRWEHGLARPLPIIEAKLGQLELEGGAATPRGEGVAIAEKRTSGGVSAELGLGGMLRRFGDLVDLVTRLAERGGGRTSFTGEIGTPGGGLRGVYGFSVRVGLEGRPVIEQFGNIQSTEAGSVITPIHEPVSDVLDEDGGFTVIVELPGVAEEDIRASLEGQVLQVSASRGPRNYRKEMRLTAPVDPASLRTSYRNGVLEIRLAKA